MLISSPLYSCMLKWKMLFGAVNAEELIIQLWTFMSAVWACWLAVMLMKSLLVHLGKSQKTWYLCTLGSIFMIILNACYRWGMVRKQPTIGYEFWASSTQISVSFLGQITTFNISLVVHGTVSDSNFPPDVSGCWVVNFQCLISEMNSSLLHLWIEFLQSAIAKISF